MLLCEGNWLAIWEVEVPSIDIVMESAYDQTKPLAEDKAKRKRFGWPICEWGSREARLGRTKYSDLQRYMYAAYTFKIEVQFLGVEKRHPSVFTFLTQTLSLLLPLHHSHKLMETGSKGH